MRVLLSGGGGFVGSHTAEVLLDVGHDVFVVDNFSTGRKEWLPPGCMFLQGDITDAGTMAMIFDDLRPEVVCHLAAQPSASRSWYEPRADLRANAEGTLVLIEMAKSRAIGHFVYSSSAAVYGRPSLPDPEAKIPETMPIMPVCPYGISKAAAEAYVRTMLESFTALRYANVYGPRQAPLGDNQVIPKCIAHCQPPHPPFKIRGDGLQLRDFIYVEDVAIANLLAIEHRPKGIFNIGTGLGTPVLDVCKIIARDIEYDEEFEFEPALPYEPRNLVLDNRRFTKAVGWRPTVGIEAGLKMTVDWHIG